jgi:hypothetical protein
VVPLISALWAGAVLVPSEFEVRSKATFELVYTLEEDLPSGSVVRALDPTFHGMRWAKWGYLSVNPQDCSPLSVTTDGASGGLVTVHTTGSATLAVSRNLNGPGIHDAAWTEVTLDGPLKAGDQLVWTLGAGGGDCGLQTSDRTMEEVTWPIQQDTGEGWSLVAEPRFDFVTTAPVTRLLVSVPSQASPGQEVRVLVAALDALGNPVPGYDALVLLGDQSHTFSPEDRGVWSTTVRFEDEGVHRLSVSAPGLGAESNPIRVGEELYGIYFGDTHTHHGHSWTDEGGFTRDLNHAYAKDVIGLSVGCESLKAYPHELDWEHLWPELQETCETHTDEDYVALLCFEWMGNENSPGDEGHHNVYYDTCDGPLAPNTTTGLSDRDDSLWVWMLEAEVDSGARSISVPHAPSYTGYNWRDRDDVLRPIAEIYSEWGDSSTMTGPGSSVYDGLAQGHRMGLIASSDNHDGWLGNRWAEKNTWGGLAAFVTTDLSRVGLFEALENRSTYATTGHRPLLELSLTEGEGTGRMGMEVVAESPTLEWSYSAEGDITLVELLAVAVDDTESVERIALWTPTERDASGSLVWDYDGTERAVWLHVVEGDNQAWSSPIWLTRNCVTGVDIAGLCDQGFDSGGDSEVFVLPTDGGVEPDCGCGGSSPVGYALLALLAVRRRRA